MKNKFMSLTFIFVIICVLYMYCNNNYQFWRQYKTDNFKTLIEYNGVNIKGLRGRQILIHKDFKKHLVKIDSFASKHRIVLIINQGYRYKKHILRKSIVKPAKSSNHHAGFAIDFNIKFKGKKYFAKDLKRKNLKKLPKNIQGFISDIRKNIDLRWGGDFRQQDPIHIDIPINLKNRKKWIDFAKNCSLDYSKRIPKWKIWR